MTLQNVARSGMMQLIARADAQGDGSDLGDRVRLEERRVPHVARPPDVGLWRALSSQSKPSIKEALTRQNMAP